MPKLPILPLLQRRRQNGVSMIEVMVSCLVLSAGLVGISAMQTRAVFNSSDTALQGYAAQILLSFGEAKLVEPNVATPGFAANCNGIYVSTTNSDIGYFKGLLATLCPTNLVVNTFPSAPPNDCNQPFQSSVNLYCKSDRIEIDFRRPVWMH